MKKGTPTISERPLHSTGRNPLPSRHGTLLALIPLSLVLPGTLAIGAGFFAFGRCVSPTISRIQISSGLLENVADNLLAADPAELLATSKEGLRMDDHVLVDMNFPRLLSNLTRCGEAVTATQAAAFLSSLGFYRQGRYWRGPTRMLRWLAPEEVLSVRTEELGGNSEAAA